MTNDENELRKILNDINKLEKIADFVRKFRNDFGLLEARYYTSYGFQTKEIEVESDLLLELLEEFLKRKRLTFTEIVSEIR